MKIVKNNNYVEIENFNILEASEDELKRIRDTLLREVVVVIRGQATDPRFFYGLVRSLGPIGNVNQLFWTNLGSVVPEHLQPKRDTDPDYKNWKDPDNFPIQRVTGIKNHDYPTGIFGEGILDWHCNLTSPIESDGVALQAMKEVEGDVTGWLNTSSALSDMPQSLYNDLSKAHAEYVYSPNIWAEGARQEQLFTMINGAELKDTRNYKMKLLQKNRAGVEGIYFFTTNRCEVKSDNPNLQEDLEDFLFNDKYIYHHEWKVGDIVLSDQLLSLHKRFNNDPELLQKRVLNRLTFFLSNYDNYIPNQNNLKEI